MVLWVAGCPHKCKGCHNPMTWDENNGLEFDLRARQEIYDALKKPHIAGITFSGGDPLQPANKATVFRLIKDIKKDFPNKNIWIYTGYTWEEIQEHSFHIIKYADVLVDGRFEEKLVDANYHWAGSTNQRVIDIQKTLEKKEVVLYKYN